MLFKKSSWTVKSILVVLTMLLSFHVWAGSPETDERNQFCLFTAKMAAQAAAAKNLGMPVEEFNKRLAAFAESVADPEVGMTKEQQATVVYALKVAYAAGGPVGTRAQEAYNTCMNVKTVSNP